MPINTDRQAIQRELEKQLQQYLAEKAEFPADYGAMMLDLGEPIGPLYSASTLTEYPIWSVTQNDVVVHLLDRLMERDRAIYGFCLERDLADVYFLVGSELASPPMVSRATFQQWIVPYAKELITAIHRAGKKAIQHYHGQIREILPDFLTMSPDAVHTIEAPPTGNCTFTQAFDIVGNAMTLIGNIQYDFFRSATQAQMREEVRRVIEKCRGRRLILSPSAGPYEPTISDNMVRNYHEFLNAAWEYGRRL
jgi:uroporphyrinogen-III decarboxylase